MRNFIIEDGNIIDADKEDISLFDNPSTVTFATPAELETISDINNVHAYTLKECFYRNHHARHDCHAKYSYGILNAIEIIDGRIISNDFSFYLTPSSLAVVSGEEYTLLKAFIKKFSDNEFTQQHEAISPQTIFLLLLEEIIENNDRRIAAIESSLERLEEKIMIDAEKTYLKEIISKRKLIMHLKHHIEPLQYVIQSFSDNENNLFNKQQIKIIQILSYKAARMIENSSLLRDYATQVREAFESERDIKSNDLMKVFTVVTSIFLPLSLVVGWYGMNFTGMHEYAWKYGYLYVILLNIAVVVSMLSLFKKKKWL